MDADHEMKEAHMKKNLTALLVLMLLVVLCACAGAEETVKTDLFDLWD